MSSNTNLRRQDLAGERVGKYKEGAAAAKKAIVTAAGPNGSEAALTKQALCPAAPDFRVCRHTFWGPHQTIIPLLGIQRNNGSGAPGTDNERARDRRGKV